MRFAFILLLVLSVFHAQLSAQTSGCPVNYINPANGSKIGSFTTADLIWQNVAGATSYEINIKRPGISFFSSLITVPQGANGITTYTLTGLEASATYQWYIAAKNATGYVLNCYPAYVSFSTADSPVPPACTFYSAPENGSVLLTQTTATLTWYPVVSTNFYDIYLWTGDVVPTKPFATVPVGPANYTATGLTAGSTYHWYIVPRNAAGGSTSCIYSQISFTTAYAIPLNDDCSGALEVVVGSDLSCANTTAVVSTIGATASSIPACNGFAEDDIWFKFTPTSKRNRISLTIYAAISPVIELFSGSCSSLQSMWCYTATATSTQTYQTLTKELPALIPGQTYYYRVYGSGANSARTNIYTCIATLPEAPSNDECSGALLLTANADTSSTFSYTGVTGYASQSMVSCVYPDIIASDVWFKFVATASSQKISVTPNPYARYDFAFQVFSGTCDNLSPLACINNGDYYQTDSVILNNLMVGNTYYMRVWDYHGDGQPQASFKIVINSLQPALTVPACSVNNAPANGAVLASATTSQLTWAAAVNATLYDVYLWTGPVAPSTPTTTVSGTSYDATNLVAATTYYWYVVPKNAAGTATGCAATQFGFTTSSLPIGPATGTGTGLWAVYYNGTALSGTPLLTRTDTTINFELTYSKQPVVLSPAPGIVPEDLFSVRWTGQIQAQYSENYTFYTLSDDGIRLWVNGVKLVDNWVNQGATEKSGSIALVAGQKYDIIVEYYENAGEAVAKLFWSSASTAKAIVPKGQLFQSGTVTAPAPSCVTSISPANGATVADQTTATLSWQAASGATSYDVYLSQGPGVPATLTGAGITSTTYTATGLSAATTYSWYIIPKNANSAATGCAANATTFTTAAAIITPPSSGTGLQGVYYNGTGLSGTALLTRIDPTINFDLSWMSPAPGIVPQDNYSVRWTGQVQAVYSENYTFYTTSDDGIRLWVNGVQLIDNWVNQGATEKTGSIALVAGQKYNIVIEYYEANGDAVTKLSWSGPSTPKAIIPKSQLYPPDVTMPSPGTGLQGIYYSGNALSGTPLLTRIDPTINFDLSWMSPAPGIVPQDNYSVRWTGQVKAVYSENYTFYTNSDDGIRLWVNGAQLADNWMNQGVTEKTGSINLVAGQKYDIVIEYYEAGGDAVTKLLWSSASTPKVIVPQSQLYPPVASTRVMDAVGINLHNAAAEKEQQLSATPDITGSISPNPVKPGQQARLQIMSNKTGVVTMNKISSNGSFIAAKKISLVAGVNTTMITTNGLTAGFYVINIIGGSKPINMKLLLE